MSTQSEISRLTAFEENDRLDELGDHTPPNRVAFRLLYDPQVLSPWSEGSTELTRLYFDDEALEGFYVPITYPAQLEEGMRSTPIGRPMADDEGRSWGDADGGDYRIQGNVGVEGHEFDVLWYRATEDDDEVPIVATEIVEPVG